MSETTFEAKLDVVDAGHASGDFAAFSGSFNPLEQRPWMGKDGNAYVTKLVGYQTAADGKKIPVHKNFRVNADTTVLRPDEWKEFDRAILNVARTRMTGIADIVNAGLTYNLGDGLATTVMQWETMSEAMEAEISMEPERKGRGDRVEFGTDSIPIPIIHVDYTLHERALRASRKIGNALDTIHAEQAARAVSDKLEQMLFTDFQFQAGGSRIYSYVNYPYRNLTTLTGSWTNPSYPGFQKLQDVMNMKQALLNANQYNGTSILYIPTAADIWLDKDYTDATAGTTITRTERARLLDTEGISAIHTSPFLGVDEILLINMVNTNVRLINGMPLTNIQWTSGDKFVHHYKVMTIQVPQLRSDFIRQSGIVHATV